MNNNENYARYFISFTIFILILFFGYKYYEYKIINDFALFQATSEDQEYRFVEKSDQLFEKRNTMLNTYYGVGETSTVKKVKKSDAELFKENYDLGEDIINFQKVIVDAERGYGDLITKNNQTYEKYIKKLSFILSPQGKLLKEFINSQLNYYRDEIQGNKKNVVFNEFMQNYIQVLQDRMLINSLEKAGKGKPKKYFSDTFGQYSQLEKYTRSDFKYINEEAIKTQRPYGFEMLDKNRKFIASYYELIKEYVFGDEESYSYKYEKYKTINSDFNIDMSKVFSEGESDSVGTSKRILENIYQKFLAGKKVNTILNKPTIFGGVNLLSVDLSMCQSYQYRYDVYNSINDKYPVSETIDNLILEFDGVNLSNKEADKTFDKSLLTFTVSKDKATFECTDQDTKQKYIFSINK